MCCTVSKLCVQTEGKWTDTSHNISYDVIYDVWSTAIGFPPGGSGR